MKREDIYSLNLHCLLLLRDCARSDAGEACYRFGCGQEFVSEICKMSMEALGGIAQSDTLLFKLHYQPGDLQKVVKADPKYRSLLLEGFNRATA